MTKFKLISNLVEVGGVISYVWKGNLLLTKVWFDQSWQVHPERKQQGCEVVTGWDETAAGQTGKEYLKAEHLGSRSVLTHIQHPFMHFQHTVFL